MSPPAPDFAAAARLDDAPLIERCLARDPAAPRVLIDRLTPLGPARVSRALLRRSYAERCARLHAEVLLRVLESGAVLPVGGGQVQVDVRVVSATDADLDALVQRGAVRLALLHRLAAVQLRLVRWARQSAARTRSLTVCSPTTTAPSATRRTTALSTASRVGGGPSRASRSSKRWG